MFYVKYSSLLDISCSICQLVLSAVLNVLYDVCFLYGTGVDAACNRNEYHDYSNGVKRGRRMMLRASPPCGS
jgi:hypothetical protein